MSSARNCGVRSTLVSHAMRIQIWRLVPKGKTSPGKHVDQPGRAHSSEVGFQGEREHLTGQPGHEWIQGNVQHLMIYSPKEQKHS